MTSTRGSPDWDATASVTPVKDPTMTVANKHNDRLPPLFQPNKRLLATDTPPLFHTTSDTDL